jgi:hypothetical protein
MAYLRAFILASVLMLAGCGAKRVAFTNDLKMSDAASEKQLTAGFYAIEEKRWRWMARRFGVVLQPPPGSERQGGTLRLELYLPDSQLRKLGPITLSAEAEDMPLAPETFMKGGRHSYSRQLPPGLFRDALVPVVFTFDKALAPSDKEPRELAAVVSEVSVELSK